MTLFPVPPCGDDPLYEGDLPPDPVSESQARASRDGREFDIEAFEYLERAGARMVQTRVRVGGHPLDAIVEGTNGLRFHVDAHGTPDRAPVSYTHLDVYKRQVRKTSSSEGRSMPTSSMTTPAVLIAAAMAGMQPAPVGTNASTTRRSGSVWTSPWA